MNDPHVISRFINEPLTVGNKKFDLRIYVLVTSYRPLKVYLSTKGFARFCGTDYIPIDSTMSEKEMNKMLQIYLTNTLECFAIEKKSI